MFNRINPSIILLDFSIGIQGFLDDLIGHISRAQKSVRSQRVRRGWERGGPPVSCGQSDGPKHEVAGLLHLSATQVNPEKTKGGPPESCRGLQRPCYMHENWGGCDEYAPSQVERNERPFDWLCQAEGGRDSLRKSAHFRRNSTGSRSPVPQYTLYA